MKNRLSGILHDRIEISCGLAKLFTDRSTRSHLNDARESLGTSTVVGLGLNFIDSPGLARDRPITDVRRYRTVLEHKSDPFTLISTLFPDLITLGKECILMG